MTMTDVVEDGQTDTADWASDEAAARARKGPLAFRTISEVADELHIPQHVLRFWETRFDQVRPLKRGGGRRYYRPDDVDLLRRIANLLYVKGYTIKGVQRVLQEGDTAETTLESAPAHEDPAGGLSTDLFTADLDSAPFQDENPELDPVSAMAHLDHDHTDAAITAAEPDSFTPAPFEDAAFPVQAPQADLAVAMRESETLSESLRAENLFLRESLSAILVELEALREHLPV